MSPPAQQKQSSVLADAAVFLTGAGSAVLLFWACLSIMSTDGSRSLPSFLLPRRPLFYSSSSDTSAAAAARTFYDDPSFGYTIDIPLKGWDEHRRRWLDLNPSFKRSGTSMTSVLLVSGSQPSPCENPIGDHLLLRLLKNKQDYCRLHGCSVFYNTALFHPSMPEFWNKVPTLRAAMAAHPEAEWLYWVDADAAFTDMAFAPPLSRYRDHNLVVHGWPGMVYDNRSWTGVNAGVFLIRNCQWSIDFMAAWASMGPQTPEYARWGEIQKEAVPDKLYPDADDQSGLVYLLLKDRDGELRDKVYLEGDYYFEGYWKKIVGTLDGIAGKYAEKEKADPALRPRRNAEVVAVAGTYGQRMAEAVGASWQRPFVTHFTGCQPCTGHHNVIYRAEECWDGIRKALDFADDQVLRAYGFQHDRRHAKPKGAVRPLTSG